MYVLIEALDQVGLVIAWAEFDGQNGDFNPFDAFYCRDAWTYQTTTKVDGRDEVVEEMPGPARARAIALSAAGVPQ